VLAVFRVGALGNVAGGSRTEPQLPANPSILARAVEKRQTYPLFVQGRNIGFVSAWSAGRPVFWSKKLSERGIEPERNLELPRNRALA
jgi:hypothetical protein